MKLQMKRNPFQHQRGAALVVGLIMLLLLTLIGVAGMRDTLLQQKMVASTKDRDIAFQAAEAALRAAELSLRIPLNQLPIIGPGMIDLTDSSQKAIMDAQRQARSSEAAFWQNWNWGSNSLTYGLSLNGVAAGNAPQYVIEKLPVGGMAVDPPGDSGSSGGSSGGSGSSEQNLDCESLDPAGCKQGGSSAGIAIDYRITARGVGSTTDAVVILQSAMRRFESAGP